MKTTILTSVLSLTLFCNAQMKPNAINVEVLGWGMLYSVNYERKILEIDQVELVGQAGIGSWINDGFYTIPLGLSVRKEAGTGVYFEVGAGCTILHSYDLEKRPEGVQSNEYILTGRVGALYLPFNNDIFFRLSPGIAIGLNGSSSGEYVVSGFNGLLLCASAGITF